MYFDKAFSHDHVKKTARKLRALHKRELFDSILVTGMSGAAMGFQIKALCPEMDIWVYRKPNDCSHDGGNRFLYSSRMNGADRGLNFLFLDDFVDSGRTFQRIDERMNESSHGKITSAMLYQHSKYYTTDREIMNHLEEIWVSNGIEKYTKLETSEP